MDSFAENDPEAFVEPDVPEDPRADDDRPPSNGDWYPEWNGSTHIPEEFWTSDDPNGWEDFHPVEDDENRETR